MRQHKIFPVDWMEYRPYKKADSVDLYYVKVANKILDILDKSYIKDGFFDQEARRRTARCIASWFEDIVSNLNIWYSFIMECKRIYGKQLPLVKIEGGEYWEGDPNPEDVLLLLWHLLQQMNLDEMIINPENPGIALTAWDIYEFLNKEFPTAPENIRLKEFLTIEPDEPEELSKYRLIIDWLHYSAYPNLSNNEELGESLNELINEEDNEEVAMMMAYAFRNYSSMNSANSLMAWTTPEWYANLAMEDNPGLYYLHDVKSRAESYYLYKSQDDDCLYLEGFYSKEKFTVKKEVVAIDPDTLKADHSILFGALIWYKGLWRQIAPWITVNKKDISEDILTEEDRLEKNNRQVYKDFLKASNGECLMYFRTSEEMNNFLEKSMKYSYSEGLKKITIGDGIMLSVTKEAGLIIHRKEIECIKDPRNPFYDPEIAKRDTVLFYVLKEFCPLELLLYLHKNDFLPDAAINSLDGEEAGRAFVRENWDFMIRYYRREMPVEE